MVCWKLARRSYITNCSVNGSVSVKAIYYLISRTSDARHPIAHIREQPSLIITFKWTHCSNTNYHQCPKHLNSSTRNNDSSLCNTSYHTAINNTINPGNIDTMHVTTLLKHSWNWYWLYSDTFFLNWCMRYSTKNRTNLPMYSRNASPRSLDCQPKAIKSEPRVEHAVRFLRSSTVIRLLKISILWVFKNKFPWFRASFTLHTPHSTLHTHHITHHTSHTTLCHCVLRAIESSYRTQWLNRTRIFSPFCKPWTLQFGAVEDTCTKFSFINGDFITIFGCIVIRCNRDRRHSGWMQGLQNSCLPQGWAMLVPPCFSWPKQNPSLIVQSCCDDCFALIVAEIYRS